MLLPKRALAYFSGKPSSIEVESLGQGDFVMRADAARAFRAMALAAAAAGVQLKVESAFRTQEEQTRLFGLYQAGTGNLAARPGYSNHQSGIAVDIAVQSSFTSLPYLWLKANAPRFGFINTGSSFSQPEPWHWEYRRA